MTIDGLIERLRELAKDAPLGGEAEVLIWEAGEHAIDRVDLPEDEFGIGDQVYMFRDHGLK